MSRKCPPGVICIENMSFLIFVNYNSFSNYGIFSI